MSAATIANLPRMTRETLASAITSAPLTPAADSRTAVVDVRDSDHVGGHIRGSIHAPSPTLDFRIPELVRQLKDKDTVVFHCALSQQRGPSAALRYIRERERLFPTEEVKTSGEGGDAGKSSESSKPKTQKVYVLEGGFSMWQQDYGTNKALTEGYDKELWEFGY